jgi:hypothetical protein
MDRQMNNFLFEDENGEYFFVECDELEEALDIVDGMDFMATYTGQIYTATEAEILGYDTY